MSATPEQLDVIAAALQAEGKLDEYLAMTERLVTRYPTAERTRGRLPRHVPEHRDDGRLYA